jgi:hypothetical protein
MRVLIALSVQIARAAQLEHAEHAPTVRGALMLDLTVQRVQAVETAQLASIAQIVRDARTQERTVQAVMSLSRLQYGEAVQPQGLPAAQSVQIAQVVQTARAALMLAQIAQYVKPAMTADNVPIAQSVQGAKSQAPTAQAV